MKTKRNCLILVSIVLAVLVLGIVHLFYPKSIETVFPNVLHDATGCGVSERGVEYGKSEELYEDELHLLTELLQETKIQYRGGYSSIDVSNGKNTFALVLFQISGNTMQELGSFILDQNGYIYTHNSKYKILDEQAAQTLVELVKALLAEG